MENGIENAEAIEIGLVVNGECVSTRICTSALQLECGWIKTTSDFSKDEIMVRVGSQGEKKRKGAQECPDYASAPMGFAQRNVVYFIQPHSL